MTKEPLPPFSCTFSPNLPELLWQLNCSLAISTYQAGKVIFLSASSPEDLVQLPRTFSKAMGMAVAGKRLAVATRDEVVVLANAAGLASGYPSQPDTYDGLYVPRATYFTGEVDLHDMAWGIEGLWAVNTRFSCLSTIDDNFSFTPRWKPPFVTQLSPDDRCHLNGLAMENGRPRYVTALGETDSPGGWRANKLGGGVLIDVPSGEVMLRGLAMPHSPRLYDGRLFALLSATGELVCVEPKQQRYEVVQRVPGFVRGMARVGNYLFVALSRLRQKSSTFRDLPIAKQSVFSGVVAIHLPTGSLVGQIKYEQSVEEIYDVKVLEGVRRPGLVSPEQEVHHLALSTPTGTFWARTEG